MKISKLLKSRKNKIIAAVLAGTMSIGVAKAIIDEINKVRVDIPNNSSIESILDSVSDLTMIDELLPQVNFITSDNESISWDEVSAKYVEARKKYDLDACNDALYKMGKILLNTTVIEQFEIDPDKVTEFQYGYDRIDMCYEASIAYNKSYTETVAGNINITRDLPETSHCVLKGEAEAIAINSLKACNAGLGSFDDVDDVYKSYQRFLLSSGNLKKTFFGNRLDLELNEEKVKLLKK